MYIYSIMRLILDLRYSIIAPELMLKYIFYGNNLTNWLLSQGILVIAHLLFFLKKNRVLDPSHLNRWIQILWIYGSTWKCMKIQNVKAVNLSTILLVMNFVIIETIISKLDNRTRIFFIIRRIRKPGTN